MNVPSLIAALKTYETRLAFMQVPAIQMANHLFETHAPKSAPLRLTHYRWMCQETLRRLNDEGAEQVEKAMRWLGFIQCGLWTERVFTLNELKDHNR